jgi:hypothetical protein
MGKPLNFDKTPIRVWHSDLVRSDNVSHFRSQCPKCLDGMLTMKRFQDGGLWREDSCLVCGQGFVYVDDQVHGEDLTPSLVKVLEKLGDVEPTWDLKPKSRWERLVDG